MKDNFLDRMNAKRQERGIKGRQDLELHDAKVIEAGRAARILATYSPTYGPPSVWDVQNWLQSRLGDFATDISARPDTVAVYPEKNFMTFVVEQKTARQPLTATTGMIKAGVDQYLDADNLLWEVVRAQEGPSYIVRRDGATIERMLEVRRQALRGGASGRKHVTLAAVDSIPSAGGGFASVDIGDIVDFYNAGQINRGRVDSVTAAGVNIKMLNGNDSFLVDPQAITTVVEQSAASIKQQDDVMRRYFSMVYPGNPKMTEAISPTSALPVDDRRPGPAQDAEANPITSVDASTKGGASHPTRRVLGKLPGARQPTVSVKR